jgi:hypothetical protein
MQEVIPPYQDWIIDGLESGELTNFQTNPNLQITSFDDLQRIKDDYIVGQFDLSRYDYPLNYQHQMMLACGPAVVLQTGLIFADRSTLNPELYNEMTDEISDIYNRYSTFADIDLDSIQIPSLKNTLISANTVAEQGKSEYRDLFSYGGMTPGSMFILNQDFAYQRDLGLQFIPMGNEQHVVNPYYQFRGTNPDDLSVNAGWGDELPFKGTDIQKFYNELQSVLESGGIAVTSRHPLWNKAYHFQTIIGAVDDGDGILGPEDYLIILETISPNDSIKTPELLRSTQQSGRTDEMIKEPFIKERSGKHLGEVKFVSASLPDTRMYSAYGIVPNRGLFDNSRNYFSK